MPDIASHKILVDEINYTSITETFTDTTIPSLPPISLIDLPIVQISNIEVINQEVSFDYLCYILYSSNATKCLAAVQGHKSFLLPNIFTKDPHITVTASSVSSITDNHVDFTVIAQISYNNCMPTVISVAGYC